MGSKKTPALRSALLPKPPGKEIDAAKQELDRLFGKEIQRAESFAGSIRRQELKVVAETFDLINDNIDFNWQQVQILSANIF
jgi:hypothetical protein